MIDYNGKVLHHAIAIPAGEGRYVLDRQSGNIKTVKGAAMYLSDPRYEVIVKRKLTAKQCKLWFPRNEEVLRYNVGTEEMFRGLCMPLSCTSSIQADSNFLDNGFLGQENAVIEDSGFSRGTTYVSQEQLPLIINMKGLFLLIFGQGMQLM